MQTENGTMLFYMLYLPISYAMFNFTFDIIHDTGWSKKQKQLNGNSHLAAFVFFGPPGSINNNLKLMFYRFCRQFARDRQTVTDTMTETETKINKP